MSIFYYTDTNKLHPQSIIVATEFIYLAINCFFGYILQYYSISYVGSHIVTTLRSNLFESYFQHEISYFDHENHSIGILTTNLADNTRLVHESSSETFANQLQAIFTCITGVYPNDLIINYYNQFFLSLSNLYPYLIVCLITGIVIGFSASWKITLVILATFPLNIGAASLRAKARLGQNPLGNAKTADGEETIDSHNGTLTAAFTHMRSVL